MPASCRTIRSHNLKGEGAKLGVGSSWLYFTVYTCMYLCNGGVYIHNAVYHCQIMYAGSPYSGGGDVIVV